jgi:hypothetical protein
MTGRQVLLMNRKIPNKPHPTPNPDKAHAAAGSDWSGLARAVSGVHATPGQASSPLEDPMTEEPTYDSCFDDLNVVLSQSMQEPDPDPNLESSGVIPRPPAVPDSPSGAEPLRPGHAPRTSEIFRSVVVSGSGGEAAAESVDRDRPEGTPAVEAAILDLGVLDRRRPAGDAPDEEEPHPEGHFPWGHVLLLSYSSALTLALIWMFWTGRIPKAGDPAPAAAEKPAAEFPLRPTEPDTDPTPPPIPPENLATIGQSLRIGDLEVMPVAVDARTVELVRTIDPDKRRRERDCLVLQLRFVNQSKGQSFAPVDRNLVRERALRAFDPYIATSDGQRIRLFPLALDSEWSILGQKFPVLGPSQSAETFIAAEPGSAGRLADEMTWRVRLRTGVYRVDMLGVRFTKAQVRRTRMMEWDDRE